MNAPQPKLDTAKLRTVLFRYSIKPPGLRSDYATIGHGHPALHLTIARLWLAQPENVAIMLMKVVRTRAVAYRKARCPIDFALYQALRDLKEDVE